MSKQPNISVAVITYNQQATIRQTLDSIVAQQGDFTLEVVIGEDCSTDDTHAICEEYEARYTTIKLLSNSHNLGIVANFARTMAACTGDFVAICAGDDYWCDPKKLQKQLDYFSAHPEIGVVSTSGYRYYVQRNEMVPGIAPLRPIEDGDIKSFYFSPSYAGGVYAVPLSLLIRRDLLQHVDFDEFVRRGFPVEDYPMQAVLAQYARWGHIPDLCVVYRVYKESATFVTPAHPNYLSYHRGLADIRRYLNELFPADACVAEAQLQEYMFYKEFLLYLHHLDYKSAKALIAHHSPLIEQSDKLRKAKIYTRTWLRFIAAHYIKGYRYKQYETFNHT